jgi:hypothetical protein
LVHATFTVKRPFDWTHSVSVPPLVQPPAFVIACERLVEVDAA